MFYDCIYFEQFQLLTGDKLRMVELAYSIRFNPRNAISKM